MNLLTLLSKSSFLVSLVCLDKYLKLLLRPTELLQKRDLDILDAYNMMEDVIKVFYFIFLYFSYSKLIQELSLCHKLKYSNSYIFNIWYYKPLRFQTNVIWSNKFIVWRSTTFGSKDIVIRKLEFVAKTQFLSAKPCSHLMNFLFFFIQ